MYVNDLHVFLTALLYTDTVLLYELNTDNKLNTEYTMKTNHLITNVEKTERMRFYSPIYPVPFPFLANNLSIATIYKYLRLSPYSQQ